MPFYYSGYAAAFLHKPFPPPQLTFILLFYLKTHKKNPLQPQIDLNNLNLNKLSETKKKKKTIKFSPNRFYSFYCSNKIITLFTPQI